MFDHIVMFHLMNVHVCKPQKKCKEFSFFRVFRQFNYYFEVQIEQKLSYGLKVDFGCTMWY